MVKTPLGFGAANRLSSFERLALADGPSRGFGKTPCS